MLPVPAYLPALIQQVQNPSVHRNPWARDANNHSNKASKGNDFPMMLQQLTSPPPTPARISKMARNLLRPLNQLLPQNYYSREVSIDWQITSPSTILLDQGEVSGPALSGTLQLHVQRDCVQVHSFIGALFVHIKYKQPAQKGCAECKHQRVEIKSWQLVGQVTKLHRGRHDFDFSVDIPSTSKASIHTPIVSIYYEFRAEAVYRRGSVESPQPGDGVRSACFERIIPVRRRLSIPDCPLSYTKMSPSTGIKIRCHYNSVMNPLEPNKVTLRFSRLRSHTSQGSDSLVWCVQKGSWRLKELVKTAAEPCRRHSGAPVGSIEEGGQLLPERSRARTKSRVLAGRDFYSGWELNKDTGTGGMELDVSLGSKLLANHHQNRVFTRDAYGDGDVEVVHYLAIELVFIAEIMQEGSADYIIRTGGIRMLGMEFKIAIADTTMGNAVWINEIPPFYKDLWPSPPSYIDEDIKDDEEQLLLQS